MKAQDVARELLDLLMSIAAEIAIAESRGADLYTPSAHELIDDVQDIIEKHGATAADFGITRSMLDDQLKRSQGNGDSTSD